MAGDRRSSRASQDADRPSSPLEHSLWLLTQREHAGPAWTMPLAASIRGDVDLAVLRDACGAVVDGHEPLRSRFSPTLDGLKVLSRPQGLTVSIEERDLGGIGPRQLRSAFRQILRQACRDPFDLSTQPALRFYLVRESASRCRLLLVAHHLIFDGPSKAIFARALGHHYARLTGAETPPLRSARIGYADYAREQRQALPALVEELRAQLSQVAVRPPGEQLLPWDRPRPKLPSGEGGWVGFSIEGNLCRRLRDLAGEHGGSMFQLLVAAYHALLYRYDNRQQVSVTAAMGTRQDRTQDLIGLFANNVPIGADVSDDPSFVSLLERVSERVKTISRFRQVPLEYWADLLNPPRRPGLNPLFQVGIAYQRDTFAPAGLGGHGADWQMLLPNSGSKCDLLLQVLDRGSVIEGRLEYSRDLFDHDTARRIVAHLGTLLGGIAAEPQRPISALPLLGDDERRHVTAAGNRTSVAPIPPPRVDQLFGARARATPLATAVASEAQTLTYAQLDGLVEDLARRLRRAGVGPQAPVGLFLGRSVEAVVAVLGVLRAGGAFVPLDPTYPAERLSLMLGDAAPALVVTQPHLAAGLPNGHHELLFVTSPAGEPTMNDETIAASDPDGDRSALAYVMYTSGSTGRPKGVMVQHASLTNFVLAMCAELELGPDDAMLALTPLSFDIALLEMLGPLISGGRVIISGDASALDGRLLGRAIDSWRPTVVQATPTTWRLLLDAGWHTGNGIKALCGGEALAWELASRMLHTGVRLWNLYGPTETTIWSSSWQVCRAPDPSWPTHGVVPIGMPIANTEMYVLDPSRNPLPVGVAGELYIGGAGLARGYLGDPALSAQRFIPDLFSAEPGSRLYRTGDRARRRRDGALEFLGRTDDQVKLRGFRIEPVEVETALLEHSHVAEAAVSLAGEGTEAKLVAYVVLEPSDAVTPDELRRFLRRSLPSHMVPSSFEVLGQLPRTPNNKLDRAALVTLSTHPRQLDAQFTPPRSDAEARVAALWGDLLSVERVGVDDDFFDLGGSSIQVVQLASSLRDVLGVELALRDLFAAPTVAEMCELLGPKTEEHLPPLPSSPSDGVPHSRAPLSLAQELALALSSALGQPALNLTSHSQLPPVDPQLVERALSCVAQRHDSLRMTIREDQDGPYQEALASLHLSLPVIDVSELESKPDEVRSAALAAQQATSFDLERGPLFAATLIRGGSNVLELAVTFSHIICDAKSVDIFWEDFHQSLSALAEGRCPDLPRARCHYLDFAAWQRNHLTESLLNEQLRYWLNHLYHPPPVVGVPPGRSGGHSPRTIEPTADPVGLLIDGELYESLARFCRQRRVTPFAFSLAVFQCVLARYSAGTDFTMVTFVDGRLRPELQGLFGCFAGPKRIRADLSGDPSFETTVKRVSEAILGMLENSDVPMNRVRAAAIATGTPATEGGGDFRVTPPGFDFRKAPPRRRTGAGSGSHGFGEPLYRPVPAAASGLTLRMWHDTGSMYGEFRYGTGKYKRATIKQVAADALRVLGRVLDDPDLRLSELPVAQNGVAEEPGP